MARSQIRFYSLPGLHGTRYDVILNKKSGRFVLGGSEPSNAAEFRLRPGAYGGDPAE